MALAVTAMTIRIVEFAPKHVSAVAELLNDSYRNSSFEFVPFDEERVLSEIRKRDMKVHVAEENDSVLGVVGTHSHPEENTEDISWLAARNGPEEGMIRGLLADMVEKNVEVSAVTTGIFQGDPRTSFWLDRGYVLCPGWLRLSARLDGLKPIPRVGEGVVLRSLRVGEEGGFAAVVNAGFGFDRIEVCDLVVWKVENPPFDEGWVQVAEFEGKLVSVVVAKPDTDYNRYLHLRRGYLGPAATVKEYRNMHLASALTARAMNFLLEKGFDSVRLGTSEQNVSSNALLHNLGFQVDSVRKVLRKELERADIQKE